MRFLQHVAVVSVFAVIAAVIIFARPPHKTAAPIALAPGAQVAAAQR